MERNNNKEGYVYLALPKDISKVRMIKLLDFFRNNKIDVVYYNKDPKKCFLQTKEGSTRELSYERIDYIRSASAVCYYNPGGNFTSRNNLIEQPLADLGLFEVYTDTTKINKTFLMYVLVDGKVRVYNTQWVGELLQGITGSSDKALMTIKQLVQKDIKTLPSISDISNSTKVANPFDCPTLNLTGFLSKEGKTTYIDHTFEKTDWENFEWERFSQLISNTDKRFFLL